MRALPLPLLIASLLAAGCGSMPPGHAGHEGHQATPDDNRQVVQLPEPLRSHTLANMRDHLAAIQEIQEALATGAFDRAAGISEDRLGMTSLRAHGAHDVARYIPDGMKSIGTEMHRSASRFAVEAANAGATGNLKPALASLSQVTRQCVACHATYRMK